MGSDGFWEQDCGWGVRVRRPFGARGMSSVRYGTRLGDLKFGFFVFQLNTQHTLALRAEDMWRTEISGFELSERPDSENVQTTGF